MQAVVMHVTVSWIWAGDLGTSAPLFNVTPLFSAFKQHLTLIGGPTTTF
jgi:hypothetical protein